MNLQQIVTEALENAVDDESIYSFPVSIIQSQLYGILRMSLFKYRSTRIHDNLSTGKNCIL